MPDLNDFYAFESTSSGRGGGGRSGSKFPWVLALLAILWLISKIFG